MGQLASFTLGAVTALFLTTFLPRVIPLKKKNITKDDLLLKAGTPPEDGFELEVLKAEQLTRNRAFLGAATLDILMKDTFVIIVGCGGVGSHAAHMLVRSGISNIRLIDFDLVTLSSLNRAPMATRKDVGKAKVHVLKEQLNAIAPWAHIDAKGVLFEGNH